MVIPSVKFTDAPLLFSIQSMTPQAHDDKIRVAKTISSGIVGYIC